MSPDINLTAFKECDIRGRYPDDVDETLFTHLGVTFGAEVMVRHGERCPEPLVVVGGDARPTTPNLKECFMRGLGVHGLRVLDVGVAATPVVYWAKAARQAEACATITASHNPPDWNGLKVMNGDMPPTPEDILVLARPPQREASVTPSTSVEEWGDVQNDYIDWITDRFADCDLSGRPVVLDPGNGCQAGLACEVFRKLGAEVHELHGRLDGTFPDRHPDSARPEHLGALCGAVVERNAALGVAFDGDGDRLAVVDNRGRVLGAEQLGMLMLQGPLSPASPGKPTGTDVILDLKCSMRLEQVARDLGGVPVRCKSGHAYMKRTMQERSAGLGVEVSGHVFLGCLDGRDDPLYTALLLTAFLSEEERTLSDWVDALPAMYVTRDVRLPMAREAIDSVLNSCRAGFDGAEVQTLDGVRLVWENGWALVRRSITEPKITVRLEGETPEDLEAIGGRFRRRFPQLEDAIGVAVRGTLG